MEDEMSFEEYVWYLNSKNLVKAENIINALIEDKKSTILLFYKDENGEDKMLDLKQKIRLITYRKMSKKKDEKED